MPQSLVAIGAPSNRLYVNGKFFSHSTRDRHHGMQMDNLLDLPKSISDPLMILKGSHEGSYVVVIEAVDHDGATIIVPVEMNYKNVSKLQKDGITKTTVVDLVMDAYGKTKRDSETTPDYDYFADRIDKGYLVFLNIEKSTHWISGTSSARAVGPNLKDAFDRFILSESVKNIKTEKDLGASRINETYKQMAGENAQTAALDNVEDINKKWKKNVEQFIEGNYQNKIIDIMEIPEVYSQIELPNGKKVTKGTMLQITMKTLAKVLSKDKTQRSRGHGNEISVEELLQIPEKLMGPAVILKNRNADHEIIPNDIIAVLDLENENGTVIVPIELKRTNGKYKIKSIFPKKSKSWIDDRIAEGDLLFIDKTKTTSEMKQTRHQSPTRSFTDGFVGNNISSTGKNVNEYNQMAGENAKTALDAYKRFDLQLDGQIQSSCIRKV